MKSIGNYLIDKEVLGKGQFGLVQKCHLKTDATKKFAVKVIQKKSLTERLFNNLKNEISILTKINSPHVIKLYDIQRTENNYYLVMELCNGGDLENLKDVRGKFSEIEARLILQQLVQGFKEIYKQQVMHRDLKLANILVNFPQENFANLDHMTDLDKNNYIKARLKQMDLIKSGFQVKIADLGFARELQYEDLSQTICGTPLVMAPEVLNGKKYNHKADVWSLGIVFFEMITGFTPFTGRDKNDLKNNLEKGDYKLPKKIQISLQGLDFLNKCLQFDQTERYSWEELCTHPYITSDPREEQPDEQMKLMYSQAHGQYIHDQIDQSTIMMKANPYSYLNNRNAILLNCKDPKKFEEAYEQAIAKHFEKDMINQQPPQQQLNPLAQSMGNFGDIVDLQEDIKEEEKFQNQFQQQINQQQQQRQVFEQKHDVKKEPIKPKEEKVNMNELIQAQRNLVLNTNQKQKENEMKEIERKAKEIEQRQLEKLRLEEEERERELQKQREQEEYERQVKEMQIRQQQQQEDLEEKKDLSDLSELQYKDASDQIDNDVLRQILEQEKAKELKQAHEQPQIQVEQQLPEMQFQFEEVKPFNEYEDLAKDKTYVEHYLEKNNTKSEMNGVTINESYFKPQ